MGASVRDAGAGTRDPARPIDPPSHREDEPGALNLLRYAAETAPSQDLEARLAILKRSETFRD